MQGQVKVVQMVQEGTLLSWNEISQAERVVSDHLPGQSDFVWAAIGIVLVWFGSCLQHPHYIISVCAHVVNKKKLGENNKEIFSSKKLVTYGRFFQIVTLLQRASHMLSITNSDDKKT